MIILTRLQPLRLCTASLLIVLAAGCSALRPATVEQPAFYSLDDTPSEVRAALSASAPTLIVNPPRAAPGFTSQHIVYVREAHQLEYYAHSEWIDSPARMLAPLIVAAIGNNGSFRAVVLTPSAADGDLRLDTEIIRLQHDLSSQPSRVRLTLRASIVDNATRKVLAWREFDGAVSAASEDPYGGVVAANQAVHSVLKQLASFCTEAAARWQAPTSDRRH